MKLLLQGKAEPVSSEIPGTRPLTEIPPLSLTHARSNRGTPKEAHPPPLQHHSCAFPTATPEPCWEGYQEPGQHGGQLPAAELPVPAVQLPQEQLGVRLGHGGGRAPLSAGQRRERRRSSHKAPRPRKRKRLHVGAAGDGPERAAAAARAKRGEKRTRSPEPGLRGSSAPWGCALKR